MSERFSKTILEGKMMNIDKIQTYPLKIESENDLAYEITKLVTFSMEKGCQIQDEKRSLTKKEEYEQISHMTSLLGAILEYIERFDFQEIDKNEIIFFQELQEGENQWEHTLPRNGLLP